MNIQSECLECLLNQSIRVSTHLNLDDKVSKELIEEASKTISKYPINSVTPVIVASDLYPKMSQLLNIDDIYKELKSKSTIEAKRVLPNIEKIVKKYGLKGAIKASVAGNVIDFATPNQFDLAKEFERVFDTKFAIDNEDEFLKKLSRAKSFMIVGDNVGEHVFDKLLLQEIKELYPDLKLYYAVRGVPIINDVTMVEAKEIGIDEVADLIDSGVDTPALDYTRASSSFMRLYKTIDLIIAKGMGNYEALDEVEDERIYHLFKVKCGVVASNIGAELGSLIFKRNSNR